jgi:hypothetical protein
MSLRLANGLIEATEGHWRCHVKNGGRVHHVCKANKAFSPLPLLNCRYTCQPRAQTHWLANPVPGKPYQLAWQ